jgi:ectoine hydroxylase-related dioxygenase (phytanoyl-CoA dioxygenase family)
MFPIPEGSTSIINPTYEIIPEEGKILIFSSSLLHMVEKNKSDEDRVSIAMNFTVDD